MTSFGDTLACLRSGGGTASGVLARRLAALFVLGAALALGGCVATDRSAHLPVGERAYEIVPPPDPNAPATSYVIVPNDVLAIQVFQEPDLSNPSTSVDNVGNIQMPLLGEIPAAGRTSTELAMDIENRLRQRYVVRPQVVVSISKQAQRFVSVEGQVKKPGVFEIDRESTLLGAIARAESPTRVAKLDEVLVFRVVNGRRMGARFDLKDIRAGRAPDPQILGGDVVVVGFSVLKGAWRDFLETTPLFNVFTRF